MSLLKERWHALYDACVGCGRADRPHIAKGCCEGCYRQARAVARRMPEAGATGASHVAPRRNWHLAYPSCRGCGTRTRPHHAEGFCPECYRVARNLGQKGHEDLPIAYLRREPASIARKRSDDAPCASPELVGAGGAPGAPQVPVAGGVAAGGCPAPSRRAPSLYARHISVVLAYRLVCPNCGEALANTRTGGTTFAGGALSEGDEVDCGTCGARWAISLAQLACAPGADPQPGEG